MFIQGPYGNRAAIVRLLRFWQHIELRGKKEGQSVRLPLIRHKCV